MLKIFLYCCSLLLVFSSCRKDLLHWQKAIRLDSHTQTDRLNKILFINDSLGFVVGGQRFYNSTVLKTTDGGNSWSYAQIAEAPKGIYGITLSPQGVIYAITFDGNLVSSADTGKSWDTRHIWYLPYKDLAFFQGGDLLLIGGISFKQGYTTWLEADGTLRYFDSLGYEFNDLEPIDGSTAYLAGFGLVMKTTDAGKNWEIQDIQNDNFTALYAKDENHLWTCGSNGSIFCTDNGGKSWTRLRNGNDLTKPRYVLRDILFTDERHGYAVGEQGLLIYTDDGGRHWMEFDRFTTHSLLNICALADGSLLVCGENGTLFKVFPRLLF